MAANAPSQDLQNISVRFNQLSDDVKKQFLEEQLKILNNALPRPNYYSRHRCYISFQCATLTSATLAKCDCPSYKSLKIAFR
jgi:hypothetical protein